MHACALDLILIENKRQAAGGGGEGDSGGVTEET